MTSMTSRRVTVLRQVADDVAPATPIMRPPTAFFVPAELVNDLFGPGGMKELRNLLEIIVEPEFTRGGAVDFAQLPRLQEVEVIVSTWGMPRLDAALLARLPCLKAVFYAAGSVSGWATPQMFARGVRVTTASAANAVPVAEFSAAMIALCLKRAFHAARETRRARGFWPVRQETAGPGGYRSTVGLVSLGLIGRLTLERLLGDELRVLVHDPTIKPDEAEALGVELTDLPTLFADSDVVSLHAPWLPQTEGLITGKLLASMKPNAAFINTARGAIVREQEMIQVLQARPDLQAILDVTHPEPPAPESPLYDLPNVFLTPHIAGSVGRECGRMGRLIVEETRRYVCGQALLHEVKASTLSVTAHGTHG